ncbi:MAG: hypothetical protein QNJ18_00925 [Xenococcaceae cyanobacterium MO_167.B52]|nr:hypothetical protein [Xenococcaceae cyanobacterium MO_167.B52]
MWEVWKREGGEWEVWGESGESLAPLSSPSSPNIVRISLKT